MGFSRRNDPAYLQAAIDGARWVITAWHGPHLVGFARAISDGVSNAYVSTVAVRPDHQRQGIGRMRPDAQRLYRSLGYVDAQDFLVRPRAD